MRQLEDYINIIPNIVSEELCDLVIEEYKNSEEWSLGAIGHAYNNLIRNCSVISISAEPVIANNPETRKKIDKDLFQSLSKAITQYSEIHPKCIFSKDSGYDLLRYEQGQYIKEHVDIGTGEGTNARLVSCSIALNDYYEGGEFSFFDRKLKYKIPKGSAIMFPSSFMYPHEVMPVSSGTRYSIITWFS
jgi:predicted 2-oxoglutarate/Fe(II)-dependent dioxygenase YbiX